MKIGSSSATLIDPHQQRLQKKPQIKSYSACLAGLARHFVSFSRLFRMYFKLNAGDASNHARGYLHGLTSTVRHKNIEGMDERVSSMPFSSSPESAFTRLPILRSSPLMTSDSSTSIPSIQPLQKLSSSSKSPNATASARAPFTPPKDARTSVKTHHLRRLLMLYRSSKK
jgi:hypothetical protein